ncbi:MAG: hypothetical protein F3743_01350 [Nitrospinae bacterium]|nr:hypothetical protein [Nitrospinota bacterium]
MKTLFHNNHIEHAPKERGSTMLVYLFVMAATAAVAFGAMQTIALNLESAEAHKKGKNAFYSAEVGLDLAVNDIINEFEDLIPYTESSDYGGDSEGYINVADYRNYAVKYKIENPLEPFLYQTVVGNTIIYHYAYSYDIEAESNSLKDSSRESVNESIRILETPLVQYFVFYGQSGNSADLELFPGPDMNSWGRIHSNADIYIGSSSYNNINLRNYDDDDNMSPHSMTAVGDIHPYKKNNGSDYSGTVRIKTSVTGLTFTSSEYETLTTSITSDNEASEEARFNNYVLVNEEPYTTPSKDLFKRGDFYEQRAENPQKDTVDGMTIIGTGGLGKDQIEVHVSRPSYTDVTDLVLAGESSTGNPIVGLPMPIIREVTSAFEDCREDERAVDTTDIDLYALGLWYEAYLEDQGLSLAGDGMLIYTSRSPDSGFTNQSGNLQAIRLITINSTSSPQLSDETTLASDNPVYIHGDFNTVNTRGVALVGDAMNVLSNAFSTKTCNITQSQLYNNYRGSETTVYAALFAGHLPTNENGSKYSGGVHSYPRLHEWWTGAALNFRGSFVNLWDSEQADGLWCLGGNCYSGPTRNWGWDVRFQNPDFWPPFIPSIFSVERVGFLE